MYRKLHGRNELSRGLFLDGWFLSEGGNGGGGGCVRGGGVFLKRGCTRWGNSLKPEFDRHMTVAF